MNLPKLEERGHVWLCITPRDGCVIVWETKRDAEKCAARLRNAGEHCSVEGPRFIYAHA